MILASKFTQEWICQNSFLKDAVEIVSPISLCVACWDCQSWFSVCYLLESVSPGFLSVTWNGQRIGTDGLTIRQTCNFI